MKIWLDDQRPMPDDFDTYCRTVEQAIELLKTNQVTEISLDYDLGIGYGLGDEVARWIADNARTLKPLEMDCHSSNPDARRSMRESFRKAQSIWNSSCPACGHYGCDLNCPQGGD